MGSARCTPRTRAAASPKFTLTQRGQVKTIAKSRPADRGQPLSTRSLSKLADFLVAEGVVDDMRHEGLRQLPHRKGFSFQRLKTCKASTDPSAVRPPHDQRAHDLPQDLPRPDEGSADPPAATRTEPAK